MATHLTLLCCAATALARSGGFAGPDEPLDAGGVAKARRPRARRRIAVAVRSPARAAAETAAAIGVDAIVGDRLRDIDFGAWSGRALDELPPAELSHWLAAPHRGVPGGETVAQVRLRVRPWLAEMSREDRPVLAITHPMTVRAILGEALSMPDEAAMRIDLPPLSATILSFHQVWRLQRLGPG